MHKKHGKLKKAERGIFHRNEWAILGTTCAEVEDLADSLMEYAPSLKIVYVDGIHRNGEEGQNHVDWGHARISSNFQIPSLSKPKYIEIADLVIVNGNHFQASRQIIVLNPIKEQSLKKRLDQCTNVGAILQSENQVDNYPFLSEAIGQGLSSAKYFGPKQKEKLFDFLLEKTKDSMPELKALVLAGGESKRMGQDKSGLIYHNIPQESYLIKLCQSLGLKTYLSKRKKDRDYPGIDIIEDRILDIGPYGAICTAFMEEPNTAWLVLACDLPFLEQKHLEDLLKRRDTAFQATCYLNPANQLPEPLIAIYEPSAYPALLQNLSRGNSCPRKALIRMETKNLLLEDATFLTNVNTPEEYQEVKQKLIQA